MAYRDYGTIYCRQWAGGYAYFREDPLDEPLPSTTAVDERGCRKYLRCGRPVYGDGTYEFPFTHHTSLEDMAETLSIHCAAMRAKYPSYELGRLSYLFGVTGIDPNRMEVR